QEGEDSRRESSAGVRGQQEGDDSRRQRTAGGRGQQEAEDSRRQRTAGGRGQQEAEGHADGLGPAKREQLSGTGIRKYSRGLGGWRGRD
ncbi:MAG: hypothetical protein LBT40_06155, partial [Deltaproteobacteria bacterium]|nr:hypothetical protein [Deltaproteobacteria bacterium]